jgi:hypothetical protein
MDKDDFVRLAPSYYALAIAQAVSGGSAQTPSSLEEAYSEKDQYEDEYSLLGVGVLLDLGIEEAARLRLIKIENDPFGPPIITQADDYWDAMEAACENEQGPFSRYRAAGDAKGTWLRSALASVNSQYARLGLKPEDFERKSDEWEPIPLDRSEPVLVEAIEKLDETIEQLRADNGYAIENPEQKAFVLDKLRTVQRRLKEDATISYWYLKEFALKPLQILVARFGKAAIGLAAGAAKEAFRQWLISKTKGFLDDL